MPPTTITTTYPDPPTPASLSQAQATLTADASHLDALGTRITAAQAALTALVAERRAEIRDLEDEIRILEEKVRWTRSYVAPMKRMPVELLRTVFLDVFESEEEEESARAKKCGSECGGRWDPARGRQGLRNGKCCAWVLASVCRSWRRLALSIPKLWSKIRVTTTQAASPDNIRLWLDRSGTQVPLDIDIYLRVSVTSSASTPGDGLTSNRRRRRRRSSSPQPPTIIHLTGPPVPWPPPVASPGWESPPPPPPPMVSPPLHEFQAGWTVFPGAQDLHNQLVIVPAEPWSTSSSSTLSTAGAGPSTTSSAGSATGPHVPTAAMQAQAVAAAYTMAMRMREQSVQRNTHWGWVALYFLVEHIRRWRRFVLRFERPFVSMAALKSIIGDAPILQEFEVSCAESTSTSDWTWLPSVVPPPSHRVSSPTPALTSLTLANVPFKYASPIFTSGSLRTLHLHCLSSMSHPLDKILYLVTSNPSLESLAFQFGVVAPPVLPLPNPDISPVRLSKLHTLRIGGHPLLAHLVDVLVCPSLETLALETDLAAPSTGIAHGAMGARMPIEDTAISLVRRSGHPDLTSLSLLYTSGSGGGGTYHPYGTHHYYLGGHGMTPMISWTFLAELESLERVEVGGTPLEQFASALGAQEDDAPTVIGFGPAGMGGLGGGAGGGGVLGGGPGAGGAGGNGGGPVGNLVCPRLKSVVVRDSYAPPEAIAKLVQMVEARNPDVLPAGGSGSGSSSSATTGGGGGGNNNNAGVPVKLRRLEVWDCGAPFGSDVVEWLKRRVDEVVVVELPLLCGSRSPGSSAGNWI
ncbi:hypothetical protein ID866_7217 [Astraeus odoratus]|nr:hypothetical protein ID866_7217 [Astraeus odoratus]